jgi:hypothetical protein
LLLTSQSEYNELHSKSRSKIPGERANRDTPSPSQRAAIAATVAASARSPSQQPSASNPSSEKRWLLRFQELETRLKAEQEGRALDLKGAKLRLDEVRKENADLKNEIKETQSASGSTTGSVRLSKDKTREGSSA